MSFPWDVIERREALTLRVLKALEHDSKDRAIVLLLSWMSLDDIEQIILPLWENRD